MRKNSLIQWLDGEAGPPRFWKYFFYFFSRSIIGFCLIHFYGVEFPEKNFTFPGPDSTEFWLFCFAASFIFATVFGVMRGRKRSAP